MEKRERLIEREYELNSPVLPDIYLGVVPITADDKQQISIDGSGTIVEWALKMSRFPEENVLDKVATRGDLSLELAKDMGRSLAKYHMTSSGPIPFDALEFDERMATTILHFCSWT
ncbi:MAG: aminoglycoside phosphotransferase family enzyme [Granulosicoccus sp.]